MTNRLLSHDGFSDYFYLLRHTFWEGMNVLASVYSVLGNSRKFYLIPFSLTNITMLFRQTFTEHLPREKLETQDHTILCGFLRIANDKAHLQYLLRGEIVSWVEGGLEKEGHWSLGLVSLASGIWASYLVKALQAFPHFLDGCPEDHLVYSGQAAQSFAPPASPPPLSILHLACARVHSKPLQGTL